MAEVPNCRWPLVYLLRAQSHAPAHPTTRSDPSGQAGLMHLALNSSS